MAIGFAVLPHASAQWWLTGYFLHSGHVGDVGSLLNQSLFGLVTRAAGGVRAATGAWLGLAAAVTAPAWPPPRRCTAAGGRCRAG